MTLRPVIVRREACLVFAAIMLGLLPGLAENTDAAFQATVVGESVAVHAEMSSGSSVVKSLRRGDAVAIELSVGGPDGEWCAIRESGQAGTSGYVLCQFLDREAQPRWQEVPLRPGQAIQRPRASRSIESQDPGPRRDVGRDVRELKKLVARRSGADPPLIQAAAEGILPAVQALLAQGAKAGAANHAGETALMFAAENGHLDIVRVLLAAGSPVDARNIFRETALLLAAGNGHAQVVQALAAAGANVNARDDSTSPVLAIAAAGRHTSTVRALLEAGADIDGSSHGGYTALINAAGNGDVETVRVLLEAGANVNFGRSSAGVRLTALSEAKARGHGEVVRMLREAGARK